MNAGSRDEQRAVDAAARDLKDEAQELARDTAKALDRKLSKAEDELASARDRADEPDDIARIERRMEARRASIRQHLADAKDGAARSARSLPVVALGAAGAVIAAVAIGYVVAQRASPTRRFVDRAREAPEAARRYIHRATRPPSAVWSERVATAAGVALAVARALPQLRALAAAIPRARPKV